MAAMAGSLAGSRQPHHPRHSTRASEQFKREFAAAVMALNKLDRAAVAAPPKPLRLLDLNGKQTTSQLAFKSYHDAPTQFHPTSKYRNRRDEESDFFEAYLRQKATMR